MASLAQNPITPPNTICSDIEPQNFREDKNIFYFPALLPRQFVYNLRITRVRRHLD